VLVASAAGADLLVVGHGYRWVTEMLHRSVSWYCVRYATCPGLVIPPVCAPSRRVVAGKRLTVQQLVDTARRMADTYPELLAGLRPMPEGMPVVSLGGRAPVGGSSP
jgi:hypothetical protein